MTQNGDTLLSIKNLSTHFFTEQGLVKAVQDAGNTTGNMHSPTYDPVLIVEYYYTPPEGLLIIVR